MNASEEAAARAAYTAGLRQIADALDANPEIELPVHGTRQSLGFNLWGADAREQMAAVARILPGPWAKEVDDTYMRLWGQIAGVRVCITAFRDSVCTRRVVGTEEREVEVEVTPAVTEKRIEAVEIVEWDCHPILGDAPQAEPA